MIQTKPLSFYTDRSAAELDDKCGMAFWWNRLSGGKGLVPKLQAEALEVGIDTHNDLKAVAEMPDISEGKVREVISTILAGVTKDDLRANQRTAEILYRRLGWLAAFALFIEPKIRDIYETVAIERELALDRNPLIIGVTPDRVLRHKINRTLVYREYKSTLTARQQWIDSWKYAIQIHTSLVAIAEELGEKVAYGQVMGLMKGDYSKSGDVPRLIHPYAWAYFKPSTNEWSHEYQRSSDWISMPVWEFDGDIVDWVIKLGPFVAQQQFPHSEPIFLNEIMFNGWVRRQLSRAHTIDMVKEGCVEDVQLRKLYFEQRTNRCKPGFGEQCPYLPLCWNATWELNPDQHPDFVERIPHHDLELAL